MSALLAPDRVVGLTPTGNLRRRLLVSRVVVVLATAAAALAVGVLGLLVVYVFVQGVSTLSWSFLTSSLPTPGGPGGVGPALLGTGELMVIATAISLPVGVGTALCLSEYVGPRAASALGLFLDLMSGVPTIVTGIFIYALIAIPDGESGLAGAIALSIVMTPLIARASLISIERVPGTLREAADALGVARWRAMLTVVLPGAAGGILTATVLAAARAAGETAPLLFNDSIFVGQGVQLNPVHAVPNIPVEIYELIQAPSATATAQSWGMAFVLLAFILLANVGARLMLGRSRKKHGL